MFDDINNINESSEEIIQENTSKNEVSSDDSCTKQIELLREQLLRINADFQNFRKRIEREKTEWVDVGQISILQAFLPFSDDLELAIENYKKQGINPENDPWLEGFIIIYKKLKKTFADLGVSEIDCSLDFNPNFHEALMNVNSTEHREGQIVQVLKKGYIFKGKVLKHAQVSVAK